MIGVLLLAQILLSPCTVEGVTGPTRCGNYRVWENRTTKQGRQIDLSVIVLNATSSNRKPDPIVFLQGGPGDAPSFNASFYARVFANIRELRDLVLIDLRGTGKSSALTCPEVAKPDESGLLDSDFLNIAGVRACRERLEKHVDLRQYTTEIAVDDLDEVRAALGYQKINLYGTSYGTRVAQVYMRRYPNSLRTVTLKGIVPPSMASPASHARSAEDTWQQLIKLCETDKACSQRYPTFRNDLGAILKQLENSPVLESPSSRYGSRFRVSASLFAEAFRFFLYSPDSMARAPALLDDILRKNNLGLVQNALAARILAGGERLAAGFFLSVSCTEDIPYLPRDLTPLVAGTFAGDYRLRQQIQACTEWPRGEVSAQHRQPTKSSIPTLILSGEFDPVTPASGGDEVMRGLTHGLHVVIRNNGHPIGTADRCIAAMMLEFIDKGSEVGIDRSCAVAIPAVPFF